MREAFSFGKAFFLEEFTGLMERRHLARTENTHYQPKNRKLRNEPIW